MNPRTRFLITAAFLCHLLLAPSIVTSQLLSASDHAEKEHSSPDVPSQQQGEDVSIKAQAQESLGPVYKLRGSAEVRYGLYILRADEMSYNSDTSEVTADGHVVLEGGLNDEHIEAGHASYNLRKQTGKFQNVHGTIGMKQKGNRFVLTTSNPFVFSGKIVEKLGPDHYRVSKGSITTCQLPRPKWQFSAGEVKVDAGAYATIYNSTFRIRGVPVFYFPFMTHPINQKARQSGFLTPNIGRTTIKGNIIGESVYLALGRSMDATVGAEYFSKRGWAPRGEFRARPTETSFVDLDYFAVLDRGFGDPRVNQGGGEVHLNAEGTFRKSFRAVTDIDYLSSYVFRLAFNDVFAQAVNSEVKSQAFLVANANGFNFGAAARRYQNFESTNTGDVITILHAPSIDISSIDRQLGKSPLHWSFDGAAEGLSRSEPSFRTADLLGRFDVSPSLSLPLVFRGWSFRPELSLRETLYTQRLGTTTSTTATGDPVNRNALQSAVELRPPALYRTFDREFLGNKWKHVIEPRITYRYVSGVSNFRNILRFDDRDILSNTNEVEYSLVNRLYAKPVSEKASDCGALGMPLLTVGEQGQQSPQNDWKRSGTQEQACSSQPRVREILTWELAQKYFLDTTFGGALVPGQRNVFATTADLTGIAFLTTARRLSPLVSRVRVQTTARTDAEWDLDYDFRSGRISSSTAFVNYRVGPITFGGGDAFLQVPGLATATQSTPAPQQFNQFRLLMGYGRTNKTGFSSAVNVGFDANLNFLQYTAVQSTYNWDCCGASIEYRYFNLGAVQNAGSVRRESQVRFTFSLSNLGSFGNMRRQERLF